MSNISNNKTPAPFKNDILSNMIQKFSEEAKKQFELSAFSNKQSLHENNQETRNEENDLLEESTKHIINQDQKFKLSNCSYNKIMSPTDFKLNQKCSNDNNGKVPKCYLQSIIQKSKDSNCLLQLLKNISLTKWMNSYIKLINPNIQSIDEMLTKLRSYSFESKSTLCEVKEITVLDCIQIITVKDIHLTEKKIVLTNNNGNYESVGDLINDYYLQEGDVFLCKNKINYNSEFVRLNINDIQK